MRHLFAAILFATLKISNLAAQELQLPPDFGIDIQLGLASKPRMMGTATEITGTAGNAIGDEVFSGLVGGNYLQPYPWKLTLVNTDAVNASSTPGGQIYIYGGILPVIGQSKGLWAAVLSHEVIHTGERHSVKVYIREIYNERMIQYYRARVLAGDKSANYALAAFRISSALLLKKMERDQEHEADQKGMRMMARAGYHPDFVFALHHLLMMKTREQSKFGAFFSDHPRWETRDQRGDRVYSDALTEFSRLWPDAEASPGGRPPVVAFVGKPESSQDKETRSANLKIPVYCRNSNSPVDILIVLQKDHRLVRSVDPEFSDKDGNFAVRRQSDCLDKDDALPISLRLPSSTVSDHDRSVQGEVFVAINGEIIANSKPFDVRFPKSKQ